MTASNHVIVIIIFLTAATVGLAAGSTGSPGPLPAMPLLTWDDEGQRIVALVPPEVAAWVQGEKDDLDGSLARWFEDHEQARRSEGFARALGTLEKLVRNEMATRKLGRFEIENRLIPALLAERRDIARALSGESLSLPQSDPECYQVQFGTAFCRKSILFWCVDWGCNTNGHAATCTVTKPIECPDDARGNLDVGLR